MPRASFAGLPLPWWVALGVLVLNDHVLKGSGLLPSIVTGKLSDFAGMIVAPVLLCAAFSVRTERARALLFVLVASVFAAIKLSEPMAQAAGTTLTALGVRSRIWCDPTDLIAFAVLPWAAQLSMRVVPHARAAPSTSTPRMAQCFALAVAALACTATSYDAPSPAVLAPPLLINWTHAPVHASITKSFIPCAGSDTEEVFGSTEQSVDLDPAQGTSIGWALVDEDGGVTRCGSAEIRVGSSRTRITWDSSVTALHVESLDYDDYYANTFVIESDDDWAFELAVALTGSVRAPAFAIGTKLQMAAQEPAP